MDDASDSLFARIAQPLSDLRNYSSAGDDYNVNVVDMQSQLLLGYMEAQQSDAQLWLNSSNRLGMHKFIQAVMPIPFLIASAIGLEFFFARSPELAVLFFVATLAAFLSLILLDIQTKRHARSLTGLVRPDRISISPQGLSLQWSGTCFSYSGAVLPWRRIAIAYYEEYKDLEGNPQRIFCLRDNIGKALKLNCQAFDSRILSQHICKRAPWAVKEASKALVFQPTQKTRLAYLYKWFAYCKLEKQKGSIGTALIPGMIVRSRYTIIRLLQVTPQSRFYLADTRSTSTDAREVRHATLQGEIEEFDSLVTIQQMILPQSTTYVELYNFLSEIERQVRRYSFMNVNTISRWLDVFVEGMSVFVVTEYDARQTLREHVQANGTLTESDVRALAVEICDIIAYCHLGPYIHHGLTPDAWTYGDRNRLKLNRLDVGTFLRSSRFESLGSDRRYTPMDQVRGSINPQTDVYACGGILYFLCLGRDPLPFQASDAKADGATISDGLNNIILKATAGDPLLRYLTIEELKADILKLSAAETSLLLL